MVPQLILSFHFSPISLKIINLVPQLLLRYSIWSLVVNLNRSIYIFKWGPLDHEGLLYLIVSQKHENPTHEFSLSSPNLHNVSFIIFPETYHKNPNQNKLKSPSEKEFMGSVWFSFSFSFLFWILNSFNLFILVFESLNFWILDLRLKLTSQCMNLFQFLQIPQIRKILF